MIYDDKDRNKNREGFCTSLQISTMGNIPTGDFEVKRPFKGKEENVHFQVKNITENNISLRVKLASGDTVITVFYPGWNVEIVEKVFSATEGQLQYGW